MTLLAWCVAWLLDVTIGDPQNWPHPVRWIGNLINAMQRVFAAAVIATRRYALAAASCGWR
jgi:cobalamin biosynthesis protein CobD/CbiB